MLLLHLVLITLTIFPESLALQWTSEPTFSNGTFVEVCVGDNVTLPWVVNTSTTTLLFIEWYKTSNGGQETTHLASYNEHFVSQHSSASSLEFVPNAGIRLLTVNLSDTGLYEARVFLLEETSVQSVYVNVFDGPSTRQGELEAYILPENVFQPTTNQWQVQLGCGHFLSLGHPEVSVIWNTPSSEDMSSSLYRHNTFILIISNPVEGGNYTCSLEIPSQAEKCLQKQPLKNRIAGVHVTGVNSRISLLEGGLEALKGETLSWHELWRQSKKNVAVLIYNVENINRTVNNITSVILNITSVLYDIKLKSEHLTVTVNNNQNESKIISGTVQVLQDKDEDIIREMRSLRMEIDNLTGIVYDLKAQNENLSDAVQSLHVTNNEITREMRVLRMEKDNLTGIVYDLKAQNENFSSVLRLVQNNTTHIVEIQRKQFIDNVTNLQQINKNTSDTGETIPDNNGNITNRVHDFSSNDTQFVEDQFGLTRIPSIDFVKKPTSCADVRNYDPEQGVHRLFLDDSTHINVFCDQSTDGGGWLVIQRRQDGSVDFYRNWTQYELGFGNLTTEFWIGLANLHHLTKTRQFNTLRVDLTDFNGTTAYALYKSFRISDPSDNYRLTVDRYSGTAGNSLMYSNKHQFSTYNSDNDKFRVHCAQKLQGAWWYGTYCGYSNLNGVYKSDGALGEEGVTWYHWKSEYRSLKRVEMKIKQTHLN